MDQALREPGPPDAGLAVAGLVDLPAACSRDEVPQTVERRACGLELDDLMADAVSVGQFMNSNGTCKTIAQNGVNGQGGIANVLRSKFRVELRNGKYTDGV